MYTVCMKVADLTVEELEAMIRRVVDEALAEHDEPCLHDEQALWSAAGAKHLEPLYGADEPEYSAADIKPWR